MNDQRIIRLSGPSEIITSVPYLLGFQPTDSLVLIVMQEGKIIVTARVSNSDAGIFDVLSILDRVKAHTGNGQPIQCLAISYDAPFQDGVPELLLSECAGTDAITVIDGRYRSVICTDTSCCPAEGNPVPTDGKVEAEFIYRGAAPASSREEMAAAFAPLEPTAGAKAIGYLLSDTVQRDRLWHTLDSYLGNSDKLRNEVNQIIEQARHAGEHAAPLYFLAAWGQWRLGNGAAALMLCDLMDAIDPQYSAGKLLKVALDQAIDPRAMPPIPLGAV